MPAGVCAMLTILPMSMLLARKDRARLSRSKVAPFFRNYPNYHLTYWTGPIGAIRVGTQDQRVELDNRGGEPFLEQVTDMPQTAKLPDKSPVYIRVIANAKRDQRATITLTYADGTVSEPIRTKEAHGTYLNLYEGSFLQPIRS